MLLALSVASWDKSQFFRELFGQDFFFSSLTSLKKTTARFALKKILLQKKPTVEFVKFYGG